MRFLSSLILWEERMVLAWLVNGFFALLVAWAAAYMLFQGRRGRKVRRTTRELVISPMSGLVMGAMLLGFQAIVQPEVWHRVAEEQKEEALEDESDNEPSGGMLFHRQLRQIRKGEDIEHLTVRVGP
jgi:uncharacterized membrane protein YGL010W